MRIPSNASQSPYSHCFFNRRNILATNAADSADNRPSTTATRNSSTSNPRAVATSSCNCRACERTTGTPASTHDCSTHRSTRG